MGVTGKYLHQSYRSAPRGAISGAAFVAIELGREVVSTAEENYLSEHVRQRSAPMGNNDRAVPRASRRSAMRLKSIHTSAWLGLVLGSVLLAIVSNSAAAGPYDTSVVKPDPGSTIALRLNVTSGLNFTQNRRFEFS
jgi:hypothetical protein